METNAEQERRRLTERYADMPLEELREISKDWHDLSDIAREALETEIQHRGASVADSVKTAALPPAQDNSPDAKLVMIRSFRDLPEALLAKGSLDSAGIESFLGDDNMVSMDWFYSNAIGGVKLLVSEADAHEATAVLDHPIPESFNVDGVGEYQQPRCPHCGSLDISLGAQPLVYGGILDDKPVPVPVQGWYCHKCSHTWEDATEE